MKRGKRPTPDELNAGHWDVADPSPCIIDLLRRLFYWDDPAVMTADAKAKARTEIEAILSAWDSREDLNELRAILGVAPKRGRRRTQRTVNREHGIAFAAFELIERGEPMAVKLVAAEANVDEKTVARAMNRWPHVKREVNEIRKHLPGYNIDYRFMLRPDKK